MEIGVGLPTNVEGLEAREFCDWARRADQLGFSSLAVTDRLAWHTWEPVVALGAAAAVTSRARLISNVVVVPNRGSAGLLAKQLLTVDRVAEGRLVVGVGAGDREDDYRLAGQPMGGRHRRFDSMLDEIAAILSSDDAEWSRVGPRHSPGGPPLLVGGRSAATFTRAARHGIGWTVSFATPDQVRAGVENLRRAWEDAARPGSPRTVALCYFGLGPESPTRTPRSLRAYYAFFGDIAEFVVSTAATDPAGIQDAVGAYAEAGADELIFLPTIRGDEQLELLADALGGPGDGIATDAA